MFGSTGLSISHMSGGANSLSVTSRSMSEYLHPRGMTQGLDGSTVDALASKHGDVTGRRKPPRGRCGSEWNLGSAGGEGFP